MNLFKDIKNTLPPDLFELVNQAAAMGGRSNQNVYLVGGAVRDLLLKAPHYDIDLAVSGNAIALAEKFAAQTGGKIKTHALFNTATVKMGKWSIDFAMLREETYERPGALPTVKPGTLETDLFRRDFTINAMAIDLNKESYGELIDLYDGAADLEDHILRVLHPNSFTDDATRIWRAFRYEQRLGFKIESDTKLLLRRDVKMLPSVGGFRLRHELMTVLQEKEPEKTLLRLDRFKVLNSVHPAVKADKWMESMFRRVREAGKGHDIPSDIYLALLAYRLPEKELTEIVKYLRLSKEQVTMINRCRLLKLDLFDPTGSYVELSRLLQSV
jgi:tRNA nucleotidyltransferase (CCA-adding enzyme)